MIKEIIFNNVNDIDLVHTFECGQCFRWNEEGTAADGSPVYVGVAGGYAAEAEIVPHDGTADLVLNVTGGDEKFWAEYFDLGTDYSEIKRSLIEKDDRISDAAEYGGGIRILNQDMFEMLISFIVSQNNNIPRIKKCIEAICERYGTSLGEFRGRERFAFPEAEELAKATEQELADMRLGYRNKYIVASTAKFMAEGAPGNYEEILSYPGVGPKVANCILLFGLHRTDAFPVDVWVKHIMNDMYGFDKSDIRGMQKFAEEKFGEYAGYAQQYLFYYYRDRKM